MDRRRSVMQPVSDLNARSGIPVPSTIKKPAPNTRMSLAGPPLRAPTTNISIPGTNPRQSMIRSQNLNPLLQSTSKPNYGRTPLSNSVRRGSLWGGGVSLAAPSSSQSIKDSRPLRDRSYQSKMRQDVVNYLNSSGFEISMATLANIQGKDYRAIFQALVLTLDPCYPFRDGARFEDEFVPALKTLRYPFAHQIDQKWLAAVASPHSWPYLLGALHWLVDLCKMRDEYLCSGHPTLQDPAHVPEEFDDPFDHKALAFRYNEETYTLWLDLHDDFAESNQAMEERYSKRNERVQKELDEREEGLEKAKAEHAQLKSSAPSIVDLKKQNELFQKDSEKLKKILQQYEGRRKKLIEQIALEKAELANGGEHLEHLKETLASLEETVKTQNLSPEEVIRMNTDRDALTRNLEDLKQKLEEARKTVMTLEVNVMNRAAAAEEALDLYTNMIASLGLFPSLPKPWQDVNLELELNSASSDPQQLLTGSDIRKIIKPTLSGVAEMKRMERAAVESELIKIENEHDQLMTECENLDCEIAEVEKKVVSLNEHADDLRDAAQQEASVASEEAARLERDLAHAKTAAIANGRGVKSRLQGLQFNYKEQIEKVSRLKEDTIHAILKNSQEIAMFKQEVSRHLQDLRDFAEVE